MKPIDSFPSSKKEEIRYLLTDIDDTLTVEGKLLSCAFIAMEKLQDAGIKVVPITGRPAGWCDHFARMWPIDGVVGENGAFYFQYQPDSKKMLRRYWKPEKERIADLKRLSAVQREVLTKVPGCAVASDQAYREADLAIDFCEDVPALPISSAEAIKEIFEAAGAIAKISSIHVNGWFGDYDKLSMCRLLFRESFTAELEAIRDQVVYCGDSPNDAPMFGFFPHSVGVANVKRFASELGAPPTWVSKAEGGYGFAEIVDILLER